MTTATATITGTITVPSQAKAASVTVKFAPYTENLRLVHPDGVVEGWELVKIDPTAGTWTIDLPLTGQAGVSPAGALWQAQERATNGAIETTVFDLTGDIDWGDIVPVADLPVTPSVLQEAIAARDAALAAEAAAQAAASAAEAIGTTTDAIIASRVNASGSATDTALKALYGPLSASALSIDGRPLPGLRLYDTFTRSDGPLQWTFAPSGHPYIQDGQNLAVIKSGRYVRNDLTLTGAGGYTELLAGHEDGVPPAWMLTKYVFTAGTTLGHNAVVGSCWQKFGGDNQGSIQFGVWPDHWLLFKIVPPGSVIVTVATATFAHNLTQDGATTYTTLMGFDRARSAVTVRFPAGDGAGGYQTQTWVDTDFAGLWGACMGIQQRNIATTDGEVQYLMVASGGRVV